jgi:hypothetical protein
MYTLRNGRSFLLQTEVGHAQRFPVVDVVQERREPQLLILTRGEWSNESRLTETTL